MKSRFLRFSFSASLVVFPLLLSAQVYEYKDASGRTVFSDQPPVGIPAKNKDPRNTTPSDPPPVATTAPPEKSTADKELEFRRRQKEAQEQAVKDERAAAEKAARAAECKRVRESLQALESGERIAVRDASGERAYLDDAQRAAEIARMKKVASDLCK